MGRRNLQDLDANRGHESVGIPLNRPPGTFSPLGGEGRDEGVRFMESLDAIFVAHGAMNLGTHVGQASSLPVRAASLPPKCSAGRMPAEPAAKMAALRPRRPRRAVDLKTELEFAEFETSMLATPLRPRDRSRSGSWVGRTSKTRTRIE